MNERNTTDNLPQPRPWVITIRPVTNGYILDDGDSTEVIEEPEDEHGEVRAAASLLWRVVELIGCYGSKHDPVRLRIRLETPEGDDWSNDEEQSS